MRYLLDTHILIWALEGETNLSPEIRARIADQSHEVYFSAINIVEIAIKFSRGKPGFPYSPQAVADAARDAGFLELLVNSRHGVRLAGLPWYHRDPFDRLLIAQSIEEGLRFLTADQRLATYSDLVETC